jgi:alcohol dehydrogenase class IV
MSTAGRVVFSKMDEVVFGEPAADAVAELTRRLGAERVFLMVSGTLNRETDEIAKIRAALGNRCAGPRSLHAVNVGPEHFDRIARQAMGTPWVPRNPQPIPTPEVLREILTLAA